MKFHCSVPSPDGTQENVVLRMWVKKMSACSGTERPHRSEDATLLKFMQIYE